MLTGCGNSEAEPTTSPVETVEESEVVVEAIVEESTEEATEESAEEVVDDSPFAGMEIVPSGQEVVKIWHYENNMGTAELPDWDSVNMDLPISAEVSTKMTDDGRYEKTVTYTIN